MSSALRKSNMIMTIRLTVIDIFYDRFWRLLSKSFYLAQARIKLLRFFHGISLAYCFHRIIFHSALKFYGRWTLSKKSVPDAATASLPE